MVRHVARSRRAGKRKAVCITDSLHIAAGRAHTGGTTKDAPIGIFDSGMGGLTVARAISSLLPNESILYVGDTKRCPYGVREPKEIREFVRQIGAWLSTRSVKLVVIACNTATAAGLPLAQRTFGVPVIGVIAPGARAAIQASVTGQVGVIATPLTIESDAYARAIHQLDAGVNVYSLATPSFVPLVENELATGYHIHQDWRSDHDVFMTEHARQVVREGLGPLLRSDIDTLVLGCTHFPLLTPAIRAAFGRDINIVSSAEETAREVAETLARRGQLQDEGAPVRHRFATTSDDITAFAAAGKFIFGGGLASIEHIDIDELEGLVQEA
jgi:glutamate racemase